MTTLILGSMTFAEPPEEDLLAGPSIEEEGVTSQDMTDRVLKEQGKSKNVGSRQQSRMWMTTLKVIDLTKDQETEIHKIMAEYQKTNQIFQATHGKEIRNIREKYDKKKRDVLTTILIGAPKDQAAISEASKKRMLELMEIAPDVTTYQEKAWVLLSAEQQTLFQTKYQALLDEHQKLQIERKTKNSPTMDNNQNRGSAPKDSRFRDRDTKPEGDVIPRHKNSVDEVALRRIKFLRRLQQLEKEE